MEMVFILFGLIIGGLLSFLFLKYRQTESSDLQGLKDENKAFKLRLEVLNEKLESILKRLWFKLLEIEWVPSESNERMTKLLLEDNNENK